MAPTLPENGTRHHLRSSSLCLGRFKKNCLPLISWLWSARATSVSSLSFFCSLLKRGVAQQVGKTGSECAKLTESLGICSDPYSLHPFLAKKRLCFTREKTKGLDFLICLRNSCFFSSQPPGLELRNNLFKKPVCSQGLWRVESSGRKATGSVQLCSFPSSQLPNMVDTIDVTI